MKADPLEGYYTVEDLADRLKRSPATIRRWVTNRYIPHTRLGRIILFPKKELAKYLEDRLAQPVAARQRGSFK